MTLSWLKQLKNGDTVEIHYITTNLMQLLVPPNIKQDVPNPNFNEKVYFKKVMDVTVWYYNNSDGEPKKIQLNNLKAVSSGGQYRNDSTQQSNSLRGCVRPSVLSVGWSVRLLPFGLLGATYGHVLGLFILTLM